MDRCHRNPIAAEKIAEVAHARDPDRGQDQGQDQVHNTRADASLPISFMVEIEVKIKVEIKIKVKIEEVKIKIKIKIESNDPAKADSREEEVAGLLKGYMTPSSLRAGT